MGKHSFFIFWAVSFLIGISACSEIVPVWVGTLDLTKDYTLYRTDLPREFEIQFDHPQPEVDVKLELELTYDISGIGRKDLPLILFLERKDSIETSLPQGFPVKIPLKENSKWLGSPGANEVDYLVTYPVIPSLLLKSGATYSLKIYANDEQTEKIYGIVRLSARLYENQVPEE